MERRKSTVDTERRKSNVGNLNREEVAKSPSTASVKQMFKELSLTPFKILRYNQLSEDDSDRRLEFCEIWKKQLETDPKFHQKVIWSGEAKFHVGTNNGFVRTHNCEFSSDETLLDTPENPVNSPGINVFGAFWNEDLIGPVFIDGPLTSENYLELLNTTIFPYIVSLHSSQMIAKELFFQHDGDPLHFGTQVRESLNENMPDRWIGRRGTIDWPPRSPDLTPIDYFLWIYMKNKVYKRKFRKMEELKSRIKEEFDALKSNKPMLKRIASSINTRVSECIKQNGEKIDI